MKELYTAQQVNGRKTAKIPRAANPFTLTPLSALKMRGAEEREESGCALLGSRRAANLLAPK